MDYLVSLSPSPKNSYYSHLICEDTWALENLTENLGYEASVIGSRASDPLYQCLSTLELMIFWTKSFVSGREFPAYHKMLNNTSDLCPLDIGDSIPIPVPARGENKKYLSIFKYKLNIFQVVLWRGKITLVENHCLMLYCLPAISSSWKGTSKPFKRCFKKALKVLDDRVLNVAWGLLGITDELSVHTSEFHIIWELGIQKNRIWS